MKNFITDVMSIGVIDVFETIDIHKQQTRNRARLMLKFRNDGTDPPFEISAIPNTGEVIRLHGVVKFPKLLKDRRHPSVAAESFHGSNDVSLAVSQRGGAHPYRHTVTIGMVQKDFCLAYASVLHARNQRAMTLTKHNAIGSNVVEQIIFAGAAYHLVARIACNTLGPFIPIGDYAFTIHKVDTIIQIIYYVFIEIFLFEHRCTKKNAGDRDISRQLC
jgi:hypothetical protein